MIIDAVIDRMADIFRSVIVKDKLTFRINV